MTYPMPGRARRDLVLSFGLLLAAAGCGGAGDDGGAARGGLLEASRDPAVVGRWDPNIIDGEVPAVSMALMHDGRVVYWDGNEVAHAHEFGSVDYLLEVTNITGHVHIARTRVLDLSGSRPVISTPANPSGTQDGDLFCSSHTFLPDGRLLAVGGTDWEYLGDNPTGGDLSILRGLRNAQYFDPLATDWQTAPSMNDPRWYPSVLTMPDGGAFVASGMVNSGRNERQTSVEYMDPVTHVWEQRGTRNLPVYPRLIVAPSGPFAGQVFYTTVGKMWGPGGVQVPEEVTWNVRQVCDPVTGTWRDLGPSLFGTRHHGFSVLLPLDPADGYRGRVLNFGGSLQRSVAGTPTADLIDLGADPPTNALAAPMRYPRWMPNGVLLPDGNVLVVGGALYDNVLVWGQPDIYVMNAELYDPRRDAWTTLAAMQVPRGYHATAVLLPDARVLVGGHLTMPVPSTAVRETVPGQGQIVERRLEIFEPPYLFRGERPVIHSAPTEARYNRSFVLRVSHAAEIESVVLVRPGAPTHSYDPEMRAVRLPFRAQNHERLRVTAPPDGAVAPPGYYMLFVNRRTPAGPTPSRAAFVRLQP